MYCFTEVSIIKIWLNVALYKLGILVTIPHLRATLHFLISFIESHSFC